MSTPLLLFFALVFLIGSAVLTAATNALRQLYSREAKRHFSDLGTRFFYRQLHLWLFPKQEYEGVSFAILLTQSIMRFGYAVTAAFGGIHLLAEPTLLSSLGVLALFLFVGFIFGDFVPRLLGSNFPAPTLRRVLPITSLYLILVFPITMILLPLFIKLGIPFPEDLLQDPWDRQEILQLIQHADPSSGIDVAEKRLIHSIFSLKDRMAREVMVPRVDMFSLSADTSIKDAAATLEEEGYSRTPIYENDLDNIVGVLMSKDLLSSYISYEKQDNKLSILEQPIKEIQKKVLHIPETKSLASLLAEFRKKQVHIAIVVDEYGGTEGIVTIEDILEEIVGEIEDEYDKEAGLYQRLPDGSWIVDARMTIVDAEEELGIKIPQEGEYDTIGGYIFDCTETIPAKGFVIHGDDFDLEILASSERSVEKVKIKHV